MSLKFKKIHVLLLPVLLSLFFVGCGTPKNVSYFQDLSNGAVQQIVTGSDLTVRPGDKVSIIVHSKDPQLATLFNLPVVTYRIGEVREGESLANSQQLSLYTVDKYGNIDFPLLGDVHVAGLNRQEIASKIKNELIDKKLIKDPVVTVEFGNLYVSVLGEVNKPGRFNLTHDKITLLDAIGMAGDLTIFGERQNVLVMREEDGKLKTYRVDLTSGTALSQSPVYYLNQKDIVYVEPNDTRARQSTVNGNNVRSTSFWISLASLLTSVAILIKK
ncbi:MAG: polysaccharide export protein [Muribaculum sp.]|nr:polysaccharide export protein [Muribaculaceae bacterium]MCM1080553.1 polysaccharide export protein [Muribaculum sp.]